jgi:hypothetical protein
VGSARETTFEKLHRLAASFAAPRSSARDRATLRLAVELGAIAVPCCARELAGLVPARRAWARELLGAIAIEPEPGGPGEDRVRRAVRDLLEGPATDDAKIDALALLAELGEVSVPASFADPAAIQRRSVEELVGHLTTTESIASAAALVSEGLEPAAIVELVEALSEIAPAAAQRLVGELGARVDVDPELRGDLQRVTAPLALVDPRGAAGDRAPDAAALAPRPSLVEIHRHPAGRIVVAIARRVPDQRRWRAMSVLIDEDGALIDGWYDADCAPRKVTAEVLAPLGAQGFAGGAATPAAARRMVAEAACRAVALGVGLPPAYYPGRDLLELGDAHLAGRPAPDPLTTALSRAVDLLAAGELARARPLLEHCTCHAPDDALAASSLGLCLSAQGDVAAALPWLERATRLEPAWPLHHWNLAAAAHQAGRLDACYLAMVRFLARSGVPAARAAHDPEHGDRVRLAERIVVEHERTCRLEGRALPRDRARARAKRPSTPGSLREPPAHDERGRR